MSVRYTFPRVIDIMQDMTAINAAIRINTFLLFEAVQQYMIISAATLEGIYMKRGWSHVMIKQILRIQFTIVTLC